MITLGGTDGYEGFDDGEAISFEVDGYTVSYSVTAPSGTTDAEQADQLYNALISAGLPSDSYEVIKNGTSVTIVKIDEDDEDAIQISDFSDNGDDDAVLRVSTGTGSGCESPENDTLISGSNTKNSTTAATFGDPATIYWKIFDGKGNSTGESGYVQIDEPGLVEITEDGETTLSFEISDGTLVAGNTLRINTDGAGTADILQSSVTGKAASVDDTYEFTVISGGTLPDNEDDVVIEWRSETGSGTIELEGNDKPDTQIIMEVDGMTLAFDRGTLVNGDVFYITTDENGKAVADADGNTLQTLAKWHWTLDSFAGEFNRSADGVTASVTQDNTIVFNTHDDLSYGFAGDEDGDSGVAAALGVNTFFTGTDASTISVNNVVSD